jgi:hypothetical protein
MATDGEEFPPAPGLIVAGVMLLLALLAWPYGYYILLRWVVAGAAGYAAWWAFRHSKFIWPWPLGALAILFNPIAPFHMTRADWQVFDLIGAALSLLAAFALGRHVSSEQRPT